MKKKTSLVDLALDFVKRDVELIRGFMSKTGAVRLCLIVSGIAVLGWPLVAYTSIFLFDATTWAVGGEFGRWLIFLAWTTYPLTFLLGLALVWRSLRGDRSRWWHVVPASAAVIQLAAPVVVLELYDLKQGADLQLSGDYVLERVDSFERIVRIEDSGGKTRRLEVVPIQVRQVDDQEERIFVRQVRAERWGRTGVRTYDQEEAFWVIEVAEDRSVGPLSADQLKSEYSLRADAPVFQSGVN